MYENNTTPVSIFKGSIIIAVYLIFWIFAKIALSIIAIGLRLFSKDSKIIMNQNFEN